MKLNEITDNPGARKTSKRLGRGVGSGKGKTSGRGVKGQKARRGVALGGFEGGQMPIHMRTPKRGFKNIHRRRYVEVNIGRIQKAIDAGKLDAAAEIDAAVLRAAGLLRHVRDGVRLLAQGEITAKISITVVGASKAAIAAVEEKGGKVTLTVPPPAAEDGEAQASA